MNLPTAILLLFTSLLAFLNWRNALILCAIMGVAQDPLRKLHPDQPVYYVVLVGAVFAVAWLRAHLSRVRLGPAVIMDWRRNLSLPFTLFVFLVLAQATHSYARFGSLRLTGIGLLVWLAPVPAVVFAYQIALRQGVAGIRRWMLTYCGLALAALSGVYLEYLGMHLPGLGEVGEGLTIYDLGTVLRAYSGFFRSSEIAAWHAATVACFAFMLAVGRRATLPRIVVALALVGILLTLGTLTGRRKMLVVVTVFLSVYVFLMAWLQRGAARLAMSALVAGAVGYVLIVGFIAPDLVQSSYTKRMEMGERGKTLTGYATRSQSAFVDLPSRVAELGVQPVLWAVEGFGWLGAGLGTGSQGTGDILAEHGLNSGAAEGGLGKITMELGIPGLFIVGWLVVAVARHVWRLLKATAKVAPLPHARLCYGFIAFLVANVASFSVATQAYSDLFILLILGWTIGLLLALPTLALRSQAQAMGVAAAPQWQPIPLQSTAMPRQPGP